MNVIISIEKLSFHVSPLGDTTAPVGPLEGWVTLGEGKANLLQEKGQTFRLPKYSRLCLNTVCYD